MRNIIMALLIFGILLSSYSIYLHYEDSTSFCSISDTFNCDAVNKSAQSAIFGIPIGLFGISALLFCLIAIWMKMKKPVTIVLIGSFIFMLYLLIIEAVVIKAFCLICLALLLTIAIASIILLLKSKKFITDVLFGMGLGILIISLSFASTSANPSGDLGKCLTQRGIAMYGAFWCGHCAHQKAMFGSGFKDVQYVECAIPQSTEQTQICKEKNITSYPTWIFPNGDRLISVQELDTLKVKSNC